MIEGPIAFLACVGNIKLRLVAYRPVREPLPEGHIRVVVQAIEGSEPITEDPVHTENLPSEDFEAGLSISRREGWDITPWPDAC